MLLAWCWCVEVIDVLYRLVLLVFQALLVKVVCFGTINNDIALKYVLVLGIRQLTSVHTQRIQSSGRSSS